MALISNEVQALQKILKRMDEGTITSEEVKDRCKVHALIAKQEQAAIQVMALSLVNGMTQKKLQSVGLIGKNEIIETSTEHLGAERITCPDVGFTITRDQCLDFSGDEKNSAGCQSCRNFKSTRNMLVPV